jgi:peptide/nickel transport system substrate-binding protein
MLASGQVKEAIYGTGMQPMMDENSFGYEPVVLEKLPSLADGDAVIQPVAVAAGDMVVDDAGQPVELAEGVVVRPAGCRTSDCAVAYDGGDLEMDQMQVTFKMLPNLTWADGTPVTASDSVYGYNLKADPDTPAIKYTPDRTTSYEAVDDVTTVWTGLPGFLDSTYFTNFFELFPEHAWGQYTALELLEAEEVARLPMGYGPYNIEEWVAGDSITLTKNPTFWRADEGLPKFDTVIYRMVGENSNANIAAILSGECDIVDQTSHLDDQSELLLELQASGQVNATFVTGTVWEHADYSIQHIEYDDGYQEGVDRLDWFSDVRMRRAILHCFDRQAVVDTVMFGQSVVLDTYLPPQHPLFNADVTTYAFDVEAGVALLEEMGWVDDDGDPLTPRVAQGVTNIPDGTPLSIDYWTTTATQRQQATQILAESAAQCGIQVNLEYWPPSEYFADGPEGPLFGRRFEIGQFAWLTGTEPPCNLYLSTETPGDPGTTMIPIQDPEATVGILGWGGQNDPGFYNPEFDAACNAAVQSLPGEAAYDENHLEAQRIFAEELPVAPLYLRLKLAATRPDMCGFIMDPTNNSEFWNIEEFDYGECAE